MKNYYETIFIVEPGLPDEITNQIIDKVKDTIKNHEGDIVVLNRWGKRRLAYEIEKKQYGFYVIIEHKTNPSVIKEIEQYFNINEHILRYMTIKYSKKELKDRERQKTKEMQKSTKNNEAAGKQ